MEFLNDYMVLVVIGICLCVGFIIKNLIPGNAVNKFIPLIMGLLGTFINVWMNAFVITPEIILGGMASGLASTGLYEAFRNFIERLPKKEE